MKTTDLSHIFTSNKLAIIDLIVWMLIHPKQALKNERIVGSVLGYIYTNITLNERHFNLLIVMLNLI